MKNSVYLESRARHASPLQDFMRCVEALLAAPGEIIDFFNSPRGAGAPNRVTSIELGILLVVAE